MKLQTPNSKLITCKKLIIYQNIMKKFFLIISIFISANSIFAQDFNWKVEIPVVDSSAYYNIFLRPEITANLNYKFSDVRIYNTKQKEVPFIRLSQEDEFKTLKSKKVKIIQNEHKVAKKYTFVLIHNSKKEIYDNFVLIIKQTDAEKWVHISGSNDLKNWHILKNNTRYQSEYSDSTTAELRLLDIPASKYEYYKILLFDYNKDVFEVYKILNYDIGNNKKQYSEVVQPTFKQDDTTQANRTLLKIKFPKTQYIDKIVFEIESPKYYLRKAELTKQDSSTGKKIRLEYYDEAQKDFYLTSDSTNVLMLSKFYAKELILVIDNNDDIPLKISNVRAFQENEYLTAFLQENQKYIVEFGNKNVPPPIYDLKFFKEKIPAKLDVIQVSEITQLIDIKDVKHGALYIKPFYLWIAFGIVIIILSLISVKVFKKYKLSISTEKL